MKKILFLNTVYNGGGAAGVARKLFEFSLQEGYDSFFAFGRGKEKDERLFSFGNKIEFLIHVFLVRFLGLEGYGSFWSTRKLINFIKRKKIDLIHINNLHGYYVNFFTLLDFLNEENIPIVWTLHDEWMINWLPAHSIGCLHCKGLSSEKCSNTYKYPKNIFPIFKSFMMRKKMRVFSCIERAVFVSPAFWLAENLKKSFLSKKDIRVISNGVDTKLFKPAVNKIDIRKKHNLPTDFKIIAFFCSHSGDVNKGLKYVLGAASLMQSENILFLGLGQRFNTKLKNIKIMQNPSRLKLSEILSASDVFLLTSFVETQPLSVLEAMSSGVDIVSFDIPAVREIDTFGLINFVEPGNTFGITNALKNDTRGNVAVSHDLRRLAVEKYSEEIFFHNYHALYRELIK